MIFKHVRFIQHLYLRLYYMVKCGSGCIKWGFQLVLCFIKSAIYSHLSVGGPNPECSKWVSVCFIVYVLCYNLLVMYHTNMTLWLAVKPRLFVCQRCHLIHACSILSFVHLVKYANQQQKQFISIFPIILSAVTCC